MKKRIKKIIIIIILIISLIVGYVGYRFLSGLSGPRVSTEEKREIKEYVENYLTKKYGEHKYEVTDIRYEYDMDYVFDYSNPTGYWVDFKTDTVPHSWIIINGLNPDDYEVDSDFFIKSYYFPDEDAYNTRKIMNNMEPQKELEEIILNELREEFEPDAYEVECTFISLDIPEDYGRIPTLEELKTNISLYKVIAFEYKISNTIKDTNEYEERLKAYITNKYNSNSYVSVYPNKTDVHVALEN